MELLFYGINSAEQICIISLIVYSCISLKEYKNKNRLAILIILLLMNSYVAFKLIIKDIILVVFMKHIICILIVYLVYYKEKLEIIVAYTMCHYINSVFMLFYIEGIVYLFFENNTKFLSMSYNIILNILLIVIVIFCILKKYYIINIQKLIMKNQKIIMSFIVGSFIMDAIVCLVISGHQSEAQRVKWIFMCILCIILFITISYAGKIERKSYIVQQINNELEYKNNELRKIKHDYGAQISYLYGMFLLKRWEDLKRAIDNIVDNNNSVLSAVIINNHKDSIITNAFKQVLDRGIHVAIEENAQLSSLNIEEEDLYYILANTGKALIGMMNDEGLVLIKTYLAVDNIIINIESSECIKNNINKLILSEEVNLSMNEAIRIVKKNNGKISFKGDTVSTKLKIVFPF